MIAGAGWVTLVTAGVAVYGAILSTHNAYTIWKESHRAVQVGIRYGIYPENPKVFLSAVNIRKRLVYLYDYWLSLSVRTVDSRARFGKASERSREFRYGQTGR